MTTDTLLGRTSTDRSAECEAFARLLDIMDTLRQKCPWDHKQTFESLRPQTIEETYELCDAILKNDLKNVSKELGDVLLHIVFYAVLGREQGAFDITDVINLLCDKLIYRHPHVYGDAVASTSGEVVKNWEQLKRNEKDGNRTVLSGVPETLPSLVKAYRIQDKARAVGLDWQKREDVWDKVTEEIGEFRNELCAKGTGEEAAREAAEEELGDLIFSIVNAARLYDLNPDTALERSCLKFRRRFTFVEEEGKARGRDLRDMSLDEMDSLWNEAKSRGL